MSPRMLGVSGILIAMLTAGTLLSAGDDPETPRPLVFGMSSAFTGPSAQLGINMRDGLQACFEEANRAGGIRGRPLSLETLDDGYEPARTAPNMRKLIESQRVLAVVGNVGTPTAVAAVPIAIETKTPFFGAYTGAGVLRRTPPDRYVINYRASYAEETGAMVKALVSQAGLRPDEIALFTQRDSYGDAGFVGAMAALRKHGLEKESGIAHGRYERNTTDVENALAEILNAPTDPKAVIMVGAYAPCARFIQLARQVGLDTLFLNVSFVGAAPLTEKLGKEGDGVIITQVVPHFSADLPIAKDYRAALKSLKSKPGPSFGSLEGYVVGRILVHGLRSHEGEPSREAIVNALESLGSFDIGLGTPLELSATQHQASHSVWPTVIRGGRVVPFDWKELSPAKRGQ